MIKFITNDVIIESTDIVFSRTVVTVVNKPRRVDSYTDNWRRSVELQLNQLGLSDAFISCIVNGYYDHRPQLLKLDCQRESVDFHKVWAIIK